MTREIIIATVVTMLVLGARGALSSTGPCYYSLRRPSWNPPNWLFGPAWTVIDFFSAWAGVIAWNAAQEGAAQLSITLLFGANIVLNVL